MSMIIVHEEFLFEESFAQAIGLEKPTIPLQEQFEGQPEEFREGYG